MEEKQKARLIDLTTQKESDIWWINFPPFKSDGSVSFSSHTGRVVYFPEFLIPEDFVPGRLGKGISPLEDHAFTLIYQDITEVVKIQLYWDKKYKGYLVFRPFPIEDNFEICQRVMCDVRSV